MAHDTLDDAFTYRPNRTLGQSGYVPGPRERMAERINQLDALLCLLTAPAVDGEGFQSMNKEIRCSVLELASSLATEVHELHEQLDLEGSLSGAGERSSQH